MMEQATFHCSDTDAAPIDQEQKCLVKRRGCVKLIDPETGRESLEKLENEVSVLCCQNEDTGQWLT